MLIELNKEHLIDIVCGTTPSYEAMQHTIVKDYGTYHGGFNDDWYWNRDKLKTKSEEELVETYNFVKLTN